MPAQYQWALHYAVYDAWGVWYPMKSRMTTRNCFVSITCSYHNMETENKIMSKIISLLMWWRIGLLGSLNHPTGMDTGIYYFKVHEFTKLEAKM